MAYRIREAVIDDAEAVTALWARYLAEHYELRDKVTPEVIRRDGFGASPRFRMTLAVDPDDRLRGAAAWTPCYDMHHFMPGIDVLDLYVAPEHRGIGVAVSLLAHVAGQGLAQGAMFVRGMGPIERTPARRLYDRVAVFFDGSAAYVSGRAFRHLAGLAQASPREMLHALPDRRWNYEP